MADAPPRSTAPDALDAAATDHDDAGPNGGRDAPALSGVDPEAISAPKPNPYRDAERTLADERKRQRRTRLPPPSVLDDAPAPSPRPPERKRAQKRTRKSTRTSMRNGDADVSWVNVAVLHGGTTALSALGATTLVSSLAVLMSLVPYIGWAVAAVLMVVGAPVAAGAAAHWIPAAVLDSPRITAVGPIVGASVALGEVLVALPLGAAVVGASYLYFVTPLGPGFAYANTGFNGIVVAVGTVLAAAAAVAGGMVLAFAGGALVAGVMGFVDGDPIARADAEHTKYKKK